MTNTSTSTTHGEPSIPVGALNIFLEFGAEGHSYAWLWDTLSARGFVRSETSMPVDRNAVGVLNNIIECYDMRSELYTNDGDCAGNLADKARAYFKNQSAGPAPVSAIQGTPRTDAWDQEISSHPDLVVRYAAMRARARQLERELAEAKQDRDGDWIIAMAGALGGDSGYKIPLLPQPQLFHALFIAIKASTQSAIAPRDEVPLRCMLDRGAITICIGQNILAHATNINPALYDAEADRGQFRVSDPTTFAAEVAREINREREDGSTMVTDMLDKAVYEAINQGAEGVEETGASPDRTGADHG